MQIQALLGLEGDDIDYHPKTKGMNKDICSLSIYKVLCSLPTISPDSFEGDRMEVFMPIL